MTRARDSFDRVTDTAAISEGAWPAAAADLASGVRELIDAVVMTDTDPDTLAGATAEVRALTERLTRRRVDHPARPAMGPDGRLVQPASPVTGHANPIAPPVDIHTRQDGSAYAEFTLGPVYEGPPGCVHGGISALILDHLLGAAAAAGGAPGMTGTLQMRYRRPTPHSVPLVAEAWLDRTEGRKAFVEGHIAATKGKPTVECSGLFVLPSE